MLGSSSWKQLNQGHCSKKLDFLHKLSRSLFSWRGGECYHLAGPRKEAPRNKTTEVTYCMSGPSPCQPGHKGHWHHLKYALKCNRKHLNFCWWRCWINWIIMHQFCTIAYLGIFFFFFFFWINCSGSLCKFANHDQVLHCPNMPPYKEADHKYSWKPLTSCSHLGTIIGHYLLAILAWRHLLYNTRTYRAPQHGGSKYGHMTKCCMDAITSWVPCDKATSPGHEIPPPLFSHGPRSAASLCKLSPGDSK